MKKLNTLLIVLTIFFSANSYSQKTNNYSDWVYFKSDKPVQFRLNKTKSAGNKVYYKIEMKLDKNSPAYSANEYRYGYVIYLSVNTIGKLKKEVIKYFNL
ncbi:hypothetical protein ACEN2I_01605 [Flavobacterium sp. W22_SRS_FK3]|uniref:hypothetical protein n=1 Tax=Flavobacterium sp. W22_SRS_FK3 TaxID=3240275 RepID=UPI003F91934E